MAALAARLFCLATFRGRAMLAPTGLTKRGDKTNTSSVGYADSSLRQKKLAAFHFPGFHRCRGNSISAPYFFLSKPNPLRWALRRCFGGRPSQPSVRTGQLPQRGRQGGGRW